MKTHARVVVIGGGVVGVSTAYHLTKKGWHEVVLCERTTLAAGSTRHAAGVLPLHHSSYTIGQLHRYSIELYKSLEAETGQHVGFHATGNLHLARTRERLDEFLRACGMAGTIGTTIEMVGPSEIAGLWPLCSVDGLVAGLFNPDAGHIAPADLTAALAIGARAGGAQVNELTQVTALERTGGGEWRVETTKGDIVCEHVVSASGTYARTTGAMVGLSVPAIPVQHQTIVTDVAPALEAYRKGGGAELAVLHEGDASYYLREERSGYLLGSYEIGAPAVFAGGVPESFEQGLFPGELERLMPHVQAVMARVPSFASAGIMDIINGLVSYTPDGAPLVGPAAGVPGFWLNEGHSLGVAAAGGAGWQLAEWMVEGEPGIDMLATDPRRFGAYATRAYTVAKGRESYEKTLAVQFPDAAPAAARGAIRSAFHDKLDLLGAVWGQHCGWERPDWFAPPGLARKDVPSFRRGDDFAPVGEECRAVRDVVGLMDLSSLAKHEVTGPGARDFLERLVANQLPRRVGLTAVCHALTPGGGVRCVFTIAKLAEAHYYLVSAGAAQGHDHDYLRRMAPADGSVQVANVTASRGCLGLAGPRARALMAQLTDVPLDDARFPCFAARTIDMGLAAQVRAMRLDVVGEVGFELHYPVQYSHTLFDAIIEAGREHALAPVGARAAESLRIEKSQPLWGAELTTESSALEAGLDRFVRLDKGDFIGREALVRQRAAGVPRALVTLEVDGVTDADARGNEPLYHGATRRPVGRATSGAYGFRLRKSLALGFVRREHAGIGTELEIEILGERRPARIIERSPYDPDGDRLRAPS